MKVLLVDMDVTYRRLVQYWLVQAAHDVREHDHFATVHDVITEYRPELIIIDPCDDLTSPTGPRLIAEIRQRETEQTHLPIIVLTPMAKQAFVEELESAGATLLVPKGVSREKLLRYIRHVEPARAS